MMVGTVERTQSPKEAWRESNYVEPQINVLFRERYTDNGVVRGNMAADVSALECECCYGILLGFDPQTTSLSS